MRPPEPLRPLLATLRDIESWLARNGIPHVFVGGIAVALMGHPRETEDVDAVVLLGSRSLDSFAALASEAGLAPRVPDHVVFARRTKVLLLRHKASGVNVDLSVGALPFEEEMIARARRVTVHGMVIPAATPEDLAIMKIVASRPKDLADIDGLLTVNPRMDLKRVHARVRRGARDAGDGRRARASRSPEEGGLVEAPEEAVAGRRTPTPASQGVR